MVSASFVADLVPYLITGLIASPITGLITGSIVSHASDAVAGNVTPMIMDPNMFFYYKKAVMAKDFTSSKLYIKRPI